MLWPPASIPAINSGYASACLPTTKKVALSRYLARRSSNIGVDEGDGPSSNVREIASMPARPLLMVSV